MHVYARHGCAYVSLRVTPGAPRKWKSDFSSENLSGQTSLATLPVRSDKPCFQSVRPRASRTPNDAPRYAMYAADGLSDRVSRLVRPCAIAFHKQQVSPKHRLQEILQSTKKILTKRSHIKALRTYLGTQVAHEHLGTSSCFNTRPLLVYASGLNVVSR